MIWLFHVGIAAAFGVTIYRRHGGKNLRILPIHEYIFFVRVERVRTTQDHSFNSRPTEGALEATVTDLSMSNMLWSTGQLKNENNFDMVIAFF